MKKENRRKPTLADYRKRDEYNDLQKAGKLTEEQNLDHLEFLNSIDWTDELFCENGKYGLKSPIGELLLPPLFDNMKTLSSTGLCKGERVVVQQNGKWGIALADGIGTWLIQPEYEFIGYPNNLTAVCLDGKWGVLNISKNDFLIPPECDRIYIDGGFMFVNGMGVYEKNGKSGIISDDGSFTEAIFEDVIIELDEFVKVNYEGQWGYVDKNNLFTTDEDEAFYNCILDS